MTVVGADAGASRVKLVLVRDGEVVARGAAPCGIDLAGTAQALLDGLLAEAGVPRSQVSAIPATGTGAEAVPFATARVNVVKVMARAGVKLVPAARTVIDVGAEEARAVRCDAKGSIADFALNDKCAAGAGSFIEAMSRALECPLEEMGPLSLKAGKVIGLTAQCVIFAESEVVSLIHRRTPPEEIARAAYDAMAARVSGLLLRLGAQPEVVVVGGVARDPGFIAALGRKLGVPLTVPPDPEFAGALGAALCAEG